MVASPRNAPESAAEHQRARRPPLEFAADAARLKRQTRGVRSQRIDNVGDNGKADMPTQPKDGWNLTIQKGEQPAAAVCLGTKIIGGAAVAAPPSMSRRYLEPGPNEYM
jgi:hypothetical protein